MLDAKYHVTLYLNTGVKFLEYGPDYHKALDTFEELKKAGIKCRLMKVVTSSTTEMVQ